MFSNQNQKQIFWWKICRKRILVSFFFEEKTWLKSFGSCDFWIAIMQQIVCYLYNYLFKLLLKLRAHLQDITTKQLINYTSYLLCKNSKTIVHVHFDRDFTRKVTLQVTWFKPATSRLKSSCQGITFLLGICISLNVSLPLLVASSLGDQRDVIKPNHTVNQSLASNRCSMASVSALGYQDHLPLQPTLLEKRLFRYFQSTFEGRVS